MPKNVISGLLVNNYSDSTNSIEGSLQEILNVTRQHLGMDIAFISQFTNQKRLFKFVDANDDFTAIQVGDYDEIEETYCKKIVDGELTGIINDSALNPITKNLPVTQKLSIGSYLGVPITLSDGEVYGTLCCFKNQADPSLMERDLLLLQAFSDLSSKLIDNSLKASNKFNDMKLNIKAMLDSERLTVCYQPIYDVENDVIAGFESLSRFQSDPYRAPDIWFNEAAQVGLGEELELMAIKNALKGLNIIPQQSYISFNISPEYILNGSLERLLGDIPSNRIVLEVTEHAPVTNYHDFRNALEPLRQKGIRLAIDDAGAGYASLQHILELNPDIIKMDISLIRDIHLDAKRRALASALIAFAREINCAVMAEGVECKDELITLTKLGVNKVQGYFIGRPMPLADAAELTINL